MATIDDYNDMEYFGAYQEQFKSLNSNIDITTPLGMTAYLAYLNFLQNRRTAKELAEIRKILELLKPADETEKQV